jgi:hypothetical protein
MANGILERRQRWAAFSVRAHRDLDSLAADVLLYDRIILPVPEDDPEYKRWIRKQWDPHKLALRVVQSAGRIIPVPWTAKLRLEWKSRWDQLRTLGQEVAYGLTGVIYASYPPAWTKLQLVCSRTNSLNENLQFLQDTSPLKKRRQSWD